MAVLVTGASGFIGLAVCEELLARGEHVVGYDLVPSPELAQATFAALPGRFDHVIGDVCDRESIKRVMRESRVDRLVSLAAITADAAREMSAPGAVVRVNVEGTVEAIHAAANCGLRRVVHLSSGSVYGTSGRDEPRLFEETSLRPESLYGITKQAGEAAALRLADLHRLDLLVGRLGTCFGRWELATAARDTPSAPFQVVHAARSGRPVFLPRAHSRDWLYARDAAAAVVALLGVKEQRFRVYNLAAGFVWSIAELCVQLARSYPDFSWRLAETGEQSTISYYAPYDRAPMAIERLRADTGFSPRYDLANALEDYLAWLGPVHQSTLEGVRP
jgi:nucleoside-diphosphate-sugar epimerase